MQIFVNKVAIYKLKVKYLYIFKTNIIRTAQSQEICNFANPAVDVFYAIKPCNCVCQNEALSHFCSIMPDSCIVIQIFADSSIEELLSTKNSEISSCCWPSYHFHTIYLIVSRSCSPDSWRSVRMCESFMKILWSAYANDSENLGRCQRSLCIWEMK